MKGISDYVLNSALAKLKEANQLVVCSNFSSEFYRLVFPSLWEAQKSYQVGDCVRPSAWSGFVHVCITAGTSGQSEPTWAETNGALTYDNTVVWKAYQNYSLAATELTEQDITLETYPSKWEASKSYSVGDFVIPTQMVFSQKVFKCITSGVSGTSEPSWNFTTDSEVNDNTVVWKCSIEVIPRVLVRVADKSNIIIHSSGTGNHVALLDTIGKRVLMVVETTTQQNLLSGFVVDVDFSDEVFSIQYI